MKRFFVSVAFLLSCIMGFSQNSRPIVQDISATIVSTNKVKVSWKLPNDFSAAGLLVYKSTQPIATKNQLADMAPLGELPAKAIAFTDTLKNYHEYYYAIIAKKTDGSIYDIVLPSINATVNGVKAPKPEKKIETDTESAKEKFYPTGMMRELPLPYLDMVDNLYKKPNILDKKILNIGKNLSKGYKAAPPKILEPYYFEDDMISPAGGDEYFLFEILKSTFVKQKYKDCAVQLRQFLSVNRTENVTNRAVFYLGECNYYMKNYRQALNLFLFVDETYPSLSKKWIESTLDFYEITY